MGLFGKLFGGSSKVKETYRNGDWYYGELNSSGDRHGHGEYHYYGNGDHYVGEWAYGKINGYGVLKERNGNRYEGEFVDNEYHGKGTYYFANGHRIVGTFRHGSPVSGTLYWDSYEYCSGSFNRWHLDGRCMYTKNGSTFPVLYDNGEVVRRL